MIAVLWLLLPQNCPTCSTFNVYAVLCLWLLQNEQVKMYAPDPNPQYNEIDLRALAEKRAARAALDAEWEYRKTLLAKPFSYTLR